MVLPDGVTGSYTCGWCSRCERLWVSIRSTSLQGVHTVNVLGVVKHDALPGGIAQIYITGPPPRKPNPGTSFPRARLYKSPIELQQYLCRPRPALVFRAESLMGANSISASERAGLCRLSIAQLSTRVSAAQCQPATFCSALSNHRLFGALYGGCFGGSV